MLGSFACGNCSPAPGIVSRIFRGLGGEFDLTPPTNPLDTSNADALDEAAQQRYEADLADEAAQQAYDEGIKDSGTGSGWLSAIGRGASAVGPGLLNTLFGGGGTKTPKPSSGVLSFLTSTPVLVGGAALVGLLILKRKRGA